MKDKTDTTGRSGWALAIQAAALAIFGAALASLTTGWVHTGLQVIAWINVLVAVVGVLTEVSCEQYPYDDDM